MDFFLFLLLNAVLFVRPAEIVESLQGWPIYNYLFIATLVVGLPAILRWLNSFRLTDQPITVCAFGTLAALVMSHLSHFNLLDAREQGFEYSKVILYYVVLISVVNSMNRLRTFLYVVAAFAAVTAAIAVLHYFEYIEVPSLTQFAQRDIDPNTGEVYTFPRLRATGLFNDPNDLAGISVLATMICLFGLFDKRQSLPRFIWIVPMAVLLLAIGLTKSRGGLLSLMAGLGTLSYFRFGLGKTIAAGVIVGPVLLLAFGGRQADIGGALSGGTGESRIELWSEGLELLRTSPLFGIGHNMYSEEIPQRQVAHNSFVHSLVEHGLLGGAFYVGAFTVAVTSLIKLGKTLRQHANSPAAAPLLAMCPTLLAIVGGVAISQMSLSRPYVPPTFMTLGTVSAFVLETQRRGLPPVVRFSAREYGKMLLYSVVFLAFIYMIIRSGFR